MGQPLLQKSLVSWALPETVRQRLRDWRWQTQLGRVRAKHVQESLPPDPEPDRLRAQLTAGGLRIKELSVSPQEFAQYIDQAGYRNRAYYDGGKAPNAVEKYLEHYVALSLLQLSSHETFIDVASDTSPLPDIVHRLKGARVFRQDYAYPSGISGDRIGGDACAIPVPNDFADAMTLTCSYEHFEGERDMEFLREAERVLAPGGRLCIVPLYLSSLYHIRTNPSLDMTDLVFDEEAMVCCRRDVHVRHARHYDVARLLSRVVRQCHGRLTMELYEIVNATSIDPSCYLRYAVLFKKGHRDGAGSGVAA